MRRKFGLKYNGVLSPVLIIAQYSLVACSVTYLVSSFVVVIVI